MVSKFLAVAAISICLCGICDAQDPMHPSRNKENTVGKVGTDISPRLAFAFGELIRGTVGKVKPKPPIGLGFTVEIKAITGAQADKIILDSQDIVIFNSKGIVLTADAINDCVGREIRFYETGRFCGDPGVFWQDKFPIKVPRSFGFYSRFTFLMPDVEDATNKNKSKASEQMKGVGSKNSADQSNNKQNKGAEQNKGVAYRFRN